MFDEDLGALHGTLRRMDPMAKVSIGHFNCCASELFWVVEEAIAARVQAKAAGTFEPYQSVFVD
jgi:hypothetical protein